MKINLKFNNLFVCAEQGGGLDTRSAPEPPALIANRTEAGEWETFDLEDSPDVVDGKFLKTSGGYYVTAEGGGGSLVRTNSTESGVWETFFEVYGVWVTWDKLHCLGIDEFGVVDAKTPLSMFQTVYLEESYPPADREDICASYCSHRDQRNEVVFDPVYFGKLWDIGDRERIDGCLEIKRFMGVNTVMIAVQGAYGDYLGGGFDFKTRPQVFADLCLYIIEAGFTPICMVGTADSGTHVEIYDGTMSRICQALAPYADKCWFCAGYEQDLDRGGGYNTRQMDDALLLMRDILGTEALLMIWLQPNRCTPADYWGSDKNHKPSAPDWNPTELYWKTSDSNPNEGAWLEKDGPYDGDEQGAYYRSGGLEIDGIFYQTDHGSNGPSYTSGGPGLDAHGQPRYKDRLIECADRFLPRGVPMPGAKGHIDGSGITHTSDVCPSTPAPDWFASGRERGRPLFIVGETVPYEYIRNQCSDEAVRECVKLCESIGLPLAGCYQEDGV